MECLRCKNASSGDVCKVCGINKVIYEKAVNISNKFYNKGLNYAKLDNMTSAIESLEQSVLFDKSNFYARNLLGLCYFRVGQMSKAIMNWEISIKINNENNRAEYYLSTCNKSDIATTISLYNSAIEYISNENIDIAITQLKKAIEKTPAFVEAINLLACCHMEKCENSTALQLIEKVLSIDNGNEKALFYEQILKGSMVVKNANERLKNNSNSEKNINAFDVYLEKNKKKSNRIMLVSVSTFILGVLITYMFSISVLTAEKTKNDDLKLQVDKLEESNIAMEESYREQLKQLNLQIEQLSLHNEEYELALESNSISKILAEAELLINIGNYKEAANVLNTIDTGVVKDSHIERFEQLKAVAYGNAKNEYYIEGKNNMYNENYIDATVNLEKVLVYSEENENVSEILYNLGIAYENLGESQKALEYYNLIVSKYPESTYVENSKQKIEELN